MCIRDRSISDAVLKNNPAIGISDSKNMDEICDVCVRGKLSRKGFVESKNRTTEVLQLVHSDLCEVRVPSLNKNRYVLCFVDDFSRKVFVYLLPTKDLVFDRFCEFKSMVETQTERKIKIMRTDNGLEFVNKRLYEFLRKYGIVHQRLSKIITVYVL